MYQPAAIWSLRLVVFDKGIGLTQNVILSQAADALRAVVDRIRTLQALIASSPIQDTYISPAIPGMLSDLCYQAGLASTILFNNSSRGKKESALAFSLRKERLRYVQDLCASQNLQTPILKDRSLRNALTHIDEHLADALTQDANVGWLIDSAIESRTQFLAPRGVRVGYCRSYIRSEHKIVHLDKELPLSALAAECTALRAVVFGLETSAT